MKFPLDLKQHSLDIQRNIKEMLPQKIQFISIIVQNKPDVTEV